MLKTFAALGAVSIVGLSVLVVTPVHAGDKVCFRDNEGVRHCVTERQARQLQRKLDKRRGDKGSPPPVEDAEAVTGGTSPSETGGAGEGGIAIGDAGGGTVSVDTTRP